MHTLYFLRRMQYRDVMCQLIIEVGGVVKNDCGHRVGVFWECATCKVAMRRPCTQQSMKHFGYVNCMCNVQTHFCAKCNSRSQIQMEWRLSRIIIGWEITDLINILRTVINLKQNPSLLSANLGRKTHQSCASAGGTKFFNEFCKSV